MSKRSVRTATTTTKTADSFHIPFAYNKIPLNNRNNNDKSMVWNSIEFYAQWRVSQIKKRVVFLVFASFWC